MKGKEPPRLICLIGPDGVGKTTQAKLLIEKLREMGYEYEYRWMRFHHFISLPVLALARLMGLTEIQELPDGRKIGYHHFYRSRLISTLYPITMYIDTLLAMIFKLYIPLKLRKKRIVCDRFVYDTLVDLSIDLGKKREVFRSRTFRAFLKLVPKECATIMLVAPVGEIKHRRLDLMYDTVLKKRVEKYHKLYSEYKELVHFHLVNTDKKNIKEIHLEILTLVMGT